MAYTFQTFSSGQVFTSGQAQQIEDNIRDHVHGRDGVAAAGLAWAPSSKGNAFSVASTDAGTLFKCYGDFQIDFAAAATLGGNFGAAFSNIGSGRIVLAANAGQWIQGNSIYVLTPGELVSVQSDASRLLCAGGGLNSPVRIGHISFRNTSLQQFDFTKLFPGDFSHYKLTGANILVSSTNILLARVSQDSGSSFLSSGYGTTDGDTTWFRLTKVTAGSQTNRYFEATFVNPATYNNGTGFVNLSQQYSAGSIRQDFMSSFAPNTSVMNAIRVLVNSYNFIDGDFELWAWGRPRTSN